MGYMADGELYVCGRLKDTIIVGGHNIYPQDIEDIANTIPSVKPGRTAAFGVDDERLGSEGVVLVYEANNGLSDEEQREVERELRRRVVQELEITLKDIRHVNRGWIVKTSNGKISRSSNRAKYLAMVAK
jgi:acyl-CoA synthetase (AMP-forming)/AMP-acid ligase II